MKTIKNRQLNVGRYIPVPWDGMGKCWNFASKRYELQTMPR